MRGIARALLTVVVVAGLLAACGGGAPSLPAPGPPTATVPPAPSPAPADVNLDPATQAQIARARRVVFLVPFAHWDTDWHGTFADYAPRADQDILDAIALARQDPRFRFTFEQVLFVQHFWEHYPLEHDELTALVRTGQLTFAWGGITQPETSLVAPEVQVRNLQLGRAWLAQTFGIAPPETAWQSDAFGNSAALPVFLSDFQIPYLFMGRVTTLCAQRPCVNPLPAAFYWQSPVDPSRRVLATYLTYSEAYQALAGKDEAAQLAALRGVIAKEMPRATGSKYLFLPLGDDFTSPLPDLPDLVDRWNAADPDTALVMADPATAFRYLATEPLPAIATDRNPAWQAYYGTRPQAKVADKESAAFLTAADKFSLLLDQPPATLAAGWQAAAIDAHYDNIGAVSYDAVWAQSQWPRFEEAVMAGADALGDTLATIASGVPAPLVLFNPSSWARGGVVLLRGALPDAVTSGLPPPAQRLGPDEVAFWAAPIPPIGFAAPAAAPAPTPAAAPAPTPVAVTRDGAAVTLDNGLTRVTLDGARGGAFTSLRLAGGPELLAAPGDDVVFLEDNGDIYGGNFGAERARESRTTATLTVLAAGPLVARVRAVFTLDGETVTKTVELDAGDPAVAVTLAVAALPQTSALVQIPTTLAATARTDDTGFGALTHEVDDRPITPGTSTYRREVFYPIESWADVSAGGAGLTLLTHGLQGLGGTRTLNLLLAREVDDGGRPDSEGVVDAATHTLHYAYLPHAGTALDARPWLAAAAFNQPLIPAWRAGNSVRVQLPFPDGAAAGVPGQYPLAAGARAYPTSFSLLAAEGGVVADLYRDGGQVNAVVLDPDPAGAVTLAGAGRGPLPPAAVTVLPVDLPALRAARRAATIPARPAPTSGGLKGGP
ncbi:MAG TPA: glycoside hydrolase family 38 C-terminal domain-containing protein [Thermomicrobiales bacterium]|nr:glycoside hydrolase family 38 C-terminal domain-containing protein [Thermomicrobiales bacterium]